MLPIKGGEMLRALSVVDGSIGVLQYTKIGDQRYTNLLPFPGITLATLNCSVVKEMLFGAESDVPSQALREEEMAA